MSIMVGNRIKLLRQANGLSLQDLADLLSASDLSIGRGSISHYETGITVPSESTLKLLAKTLGTAVDFFEMDDWEDVSINIFTPTEGNTVRYDNQIQSFVQIQLEKLIQIDEILDDHISCKIPCITKVEKGSEALVENVAERFRMDLSLGDQPISSVCNTLEQFGWLTIEMDEKSPYISGFEASSKTGFLIYPSLFAIDDHRIDLLSSVGYALLQGETPAHTKCLVERFARAVLFPRKQVAFEFENNRENVSILELTMAKQKYGISKRQIMKRLLELGIISQNFYDSFVDLLLLHGFPKRKQVLAEHLMFNEFPTLYTMKVLRAQYKGLIDSHKADILLMTKHLI